RAYVLTAEAILSVDADGAVKGNLPVELAINLQDKRGASGRLLEGENGEVYYVKDELGISITETYLLNEGETLRMTPISFLSARSGLDLFEGTNGILRMTSEGMYRCDVTGSTMEEILKWGDSSLIAEDVSEVVQITEDHYLVEILSVRGMGSEIQLLTRTSVEELPERENIVIASLNPSADLRRCVVEYNLASEKYHVSIETYSGDPEGKYVRLDADLVSRDAPDILDFSGLDVSKYAEREMLEDLSPYLERDGGIDREDYLGNLLEDYTIKNRLVGIPKKFSAWVFWWVPQDTGGQGGWGMEDFMALAEKYPDRRVFSRDPSLYGTEYLLREFCAPYYLERFVNRDEGTCRFDSEEFRGFLEWAGTQDRKNEQAQEALLGEHQLGFGLYEYYRVLYGDNTVMRGYPSVNGEEVYIASAEDALGILADSEYKEGAWEFLCYFLKDHGDGNDLPTRKALLEEVVKEARRPGGTYYFNGVPATVPELSEAHVALVMQAIESIDFTPRSSPENDIVDIVWEEIQYLLDGSKTAEEVAVAIQNRAELVLQEM
ncbi:MAG: extracellular solute-binding protein, partial [Lachnospiraceae bacterium]|nr:extracellular solute-binding protein [Lachnospiraceae bacterium]